MDIRTDRRMNRTARRWASTAGGASRDDRTGFGNTAAYGWVITYQANIRFFDRTPSLRRFGVSTMVVARRG